MTIFQDEHEAFRHDFHSLKLFHLKEISHTRKEKDSYEGHKEDNQKSHNKKAKEDLCLRPLRHGSDRVQGGIRCYPFDVLWRGDEAEENKEKLNLPLKFFLVTKKVNDPAQRAGHSWAVVKGESG